jgi:hypothetical protein
MLGVAKRPTGAIDPSCSQEMVMKQKTQRPLSTPGPGRTSMPTPPTPPNPRTMPAEPAEVLGRHKNTGQKDHKGAR